MEDAGLAGCIVTLRVAGEAHCCRGRQHKGMLCHHMPSPPRIGDAAVASWALGTMDASGCQHANSRHGLGGGTQVQRGHRAERAPCDIFIAQPAAVLPRPTGRWSWGRWDWWTRPPAAPVAASLPRQRHLVSASSATPTLGGMFMNLCRLRSASSLTGLRCTFSMRASCLPPGQERPPLMEGSIHIAGRACRCSAPPAQLSKLDRAYK